MAVISGVYSQDADTLPKFKLSGSADAYYRYNFSDPRALPNGNNNYNNLTSFTNSQNSFELGMLSLKAEHSFGKASLVGDFGFGRRVEEFSYTEKLALNNTVSLANIKQLYMSYAVSDKFKVTAGKWATHVGYELVDAYLNRNYSMSYMFSYGPFFHTGVKADVSLGGKTGFMLGIASPTDFTTTTSTSKFVIGQFSTGSADDKFKLYLNYQGGKYAVGSNLNQFDVVVTAALADKFSMGYNGTIQSRKPMGGDKGSWWGSALYLNADPTSNFGLTLRAEYVDDEENVVGIGNNVIETTLTGIFKVGNLAIMPELRLDRASNKLTSPFRKNVGSGTATATNQSTVTALIAATYNF